MVTKKPSDGVDITLADRIEENAKKIVQSLRKHDQAQGRTAALKVLAQAYDDGASEVDKMSLEELRIHAKNLVCMTTHLLQMLIHADANRVALGIQDNETKIKLARSVKELGGAANIASAKYRRGANSTNAAYIAAKKKVRDHWFRLSPRDRARHGAVKFFASEIASKVENTTFDGVRRWVAEFRKEASNR